MAAELYSNREQYEFWRNQGMCVDALTPSLVTDRYKFGEYVGYMRNIYGSPFPVYGDTPEHVKSLISSEIDQYMLKYKKLLEAESPTDEQA